MWDANKYEFKQDPVPAWGGEDPNRREWWEEKFKFAINSAQRKMAEVNDGGSNNDNGGDDDA